MDAPTDDTKSVMLSLSTEPSSGTDVLFPERRITLTRNSPTLTIGRASKVSTKGFIAGADNAWFDSPVMSRLHARLCAKMDDKKVEITDLGSLHGTFLNGNERIEVEKPRVLKDGDILRFGAPIWHGTKQFMPTSVKVGFQFPHHDRPRSFRVPDESDDDVSEVEANAADKYMSHASKLSPAANNISGQARSQDRVIDLTTAYSSHKVRHIIDLSSPCGSPIRIDDEEDMPVVEEGKNNTYTPSTSPELGLPVVPAFSSDGKDDRGHVAGVPDTDVSVFGSRVGWSDDEMEYEDDAHSMSVESDEESQVDYPDEESDSEVDNYNEGTSDEEMEDEIEDIVGSGSEDYASDGSDLIISAPNGGESWDLHEGGYRPSVDRTYDHWELPQSFQEAEYPEIMPLIGSLSPPTAASHPSNPTETKSRVINSCSIDLMLNDDQPSAAAPSSGANHAGQETRTVDSQAREPSPSEGFYTTVASCSSPAAAAAKALGAKVGKIDYFVAREENKTAINAQKVADQRPPSSVHALCNADETHALGNADETATERSSHSFAPAGQQAAAPPANDSVLPRLADLDAFSRPLLPSNDVAEQTMPNPISIPRQFLPVMASPVSLDEEAEIDCHQMGVTDVLDTCQDGSGEGKLKRKADDISETTHEQEQWAAKAATALSPAPSVAEEEEQSQVLEPHIDPSGETAEPSAPLGSSSTQGIEHVSTAASQATLERPVKRARMMRVAERIGYAALGGVTAGAMIFGTLIYTAPTF